MIMDFFMLKLKMKIILSLVNYGIKIIMNLKLILISTLPNYSNVELNLQKKNIISNEMIEKLEGFHKIKDKHKIQLKSCNLKNITSIHCHNAWITSVSIFPSGNIISTS